MKLNSKLIKDFFKNTKSNSTTDAYCCDYINGIGTTIKKLTEVNNQQTTKTVSDITEYKYLLVLSGYGYTKSTSIIPVSLFKSLASYTTCYTYIKTYGGNGIVSIQYISDTSIKINGNAGTDVITAVYGIK